MKITRKSFSSVVPVLKSWYFALILTLVIGIAPFVISLSEKIPAYSLTHEISIANNENLNGDFHFFWKDKELKQIKQVYLTVWNDGKTFIDYSDFTKSAPINFIPKINSVDIHDVKVVKKSRISLNVVPKIIEADSIEYVGFDFVGDDALEKNDGFKLRVTYSSDTIAHWDLKGRVKGARNGVGFEKIELDEKRESSLSNIVSITLFIIILNDYPQ